MKRVYKYQLSVNDHQKLQVPISESEKFSDCVLYCGVQADVPCLWVMVDDDESFRTVEITLHGTGHLAEDTVGLKHVGSFMLLNGQFVGHVFA